MAGVDCAEEGVRHGMHRVGQISCAQDGIVHKSGRGHHRSSSNYCGGNSRGSNNMRSSKKAVVAKASQNDLSISISLPLLVVVSMVVVVVQGRGAGDRDVGTVHTGGALEAKRVAVVGETVVTSMRVGAPLLTAGHCSTEVVGAETDMAGVDESGSSGNNSMAWVGDSRGNSGNCRGSNNSVVAKTVANGAKTSNNHLSISLSLPLLAAARHSSSKIVGAEANMAGVDEACRGGSNSMDWVGQGRGTKNSRGGGGNNSMVAKTVAKTSKDHLSISLSLPLLLSKGPCSIGESGIGQGCPGAWDGKVQSVHARSTLSSKGVHSIGIWDGEGGVDHVGRGDGRKRGKSNEKLHDGVVVMQL